MFLEGFCAFLICPKCLYQTQLSIVRKGWNEEVRHSFFLFCLFGQLVRAKGTPSGRNLRSRPARSADLDGLVRVL